MYLDTDLVQKIEETMRGLNAEAEKYAKPVRKRYPVFFALLITFGVAAIFQGFEILFNQIGLFRQHPLVLVLVGVVVLLLTGALYRALQKNG